MKRDTQVEGLIFLFAVFLALTITLAACCAPKPNPQPPAPGPEKVNVQKDDVAQGRGWTLEDMGFSRVIAVEFVPIQFALGSARIPADQKELLANIAEDAKSKLRCTVAGHACPLGGIAYNEALSRRRAEAVVMSLRMRGVETGIQVLAHGEDSLVTTDPAEYWQNRRVVVECEQ